MTWDSRLLGELVEFKVGKTPARANERYWGGTHPWLSIKDMNQGLDITTTKESISDLAVSETKPFLVPEGTVLLSFKLSVGKVGIARRALFTNEAIAALVPRPNAPIDPSYLLRALQYVDISGGGNDAVLGVTLNRAGLAAIRIPLPPLPEQRRIAAVLDGADALRRQASRATGLAADVMRAKGDAAVGRSVPLAQCVTISSGKSIVGSEDSDSSARVLKISSVTSGIFLETESKPLPSGYEPPAAHLVHAGDLLVSRANTAELVGASAFVYDEPSRPVALPDKLWRLTVNRKIADPSYLHSQISSAVFRSEVSRRATGSGGSMKNIGQSQFLSIPVSLPPLEWQQQFAVIASKIRAVQGILTARARELDILFASLQHQAFRGDL